MRTTPKGPLLLLAACLLGLAPTRAATVITNCAETDLRAALAAGGTILFDEDCSITLTNTLTITKYVLLNTAGHTVTISGGNSYRIFTVLPGATLVMNGLSLTAGQSTAGGAICVHSGAQAWLTNCILSGNNATGSNGLAGVAGNTNSANSGTDGTGGTAGLSGQGGAIFNQGALTLWHCQVVSNNATGGSGGNGGDGTGGSFRGANGGNGGAGAPAFGGAICNYGYTLLRDCAFSGNSASAGSGGTGGAAGNGSFGGFPGSGGAGAGAYGAGVYNGYSLTVANCTFADNTAQGGNSAAAGTRRSDNGSDGPRGGNSFGGGICNVYASVLTNSTFSNNRVSAGAGGNGGSGNFIAGKGGDGGDGAGGGLYNSSSMIVVNCTLTGCAASGGTNGFAGGGISSRADGSPGQSRGGGLANDAGTLILRNSLLSTNSPGGNASGSILDAGYNLSSDASVTLGPYSLVNSNPRLLALADNGGPTKTAALSASSPARDRIPANFPLTDQRGIPRPVNYYADIGAVEYENAGPPKISVQPANRTVSQSSSVTFTVTAAGASPLTFLWFFNGVAQTNTYTATGLGGLVANSVTIPSVAATDAGRIWVRVTNASGSVLSARASLTIRPLIVWGAGATNTGTNPDYGQSIVPPDLTNVAAVSAGGFHTLTLLKDGSVTAWGAGTDDFSTEVSFGQSVTPPGLSNVVAVAAGGYHSLSLDTNGTVVAWGNDQSGQTDVPPGLVNAQAIAAGFYHSLAIQRDGTVVAWGDNTSGQTNVPAGLTSVIAVSGGAQHSLALRSDGTVAAWGDNSSGQTDLPPDLTNIVAISAGWSHNLALRNTGRVVAWGDDSAGQTDVPPGLTNIVAISAGGLHSLALKQGGTVVVWGDDTYGQTTLPSNTVYTAAIAAGAYHNALLANSGVPVILRQPLEKAALPGGAVVFNVGAAGASPLRYQWRLNGKKLSGATASSYAPKNLQSTNSGSYTVVITNSLGTITSAPATLIVSAVPVITSQPLGRTVPQGSNVTFTVTAHGAAPLSYQWLFNATNILAAGTNASFTWSNAQLTNAGAYTVFITNSVGGTNSTPARLTVTAAPTIVTQPANLTVVIHSNALFNVSATGFPALAYQWRLHATNLPGKTGSSLAVTNAQPRNAGAYTVFITNTVGSILSTQAILVVLGPPAVLAPPTNLTVFAGHDAAFSVTAIGAPNLFYQWRFNGTNIAGATTTNLTVAGAQQINAGAYAVVITNAYGGITSSAAILIVQTPAFITRQPSSLSVLTGSNATFTVAADGSPPLTYQWRFNGVNIDGAISSTFTRSQAHADQAGQYVVVVSNPYGNAASFPPATLTVLSASPVLNALGFVSNRFRLAFQSESNVTYLVEYKSNLNDTAWNALAATNATGGRVTVEDPTPGWPARFYRLRVP